MIPIKSWQNSKADCVIMSDYKKRSFNRPGFKENYYTLLASISTLSLCIK